jgi:hypothetical protein
MLSLFSSGCARGALPKDGVIIGVRQRLAHP